MLAPVRDILDQELQQKPRRTIDHPLHRPTLHTLSQPHRAKKLTQLHPPCDRDDINQTLNVRRWEITDQTPRTRRLPNMTYNNTNHQSLPHRCIRHHPP